MNSLSFRSSFVVNTEPIEPNINGIFPIMRNSARVSVTISHFHPSLTSVGKARSLPLEQSATCGYILVGFGLAVKYYTKIEVTNNDKHSNLPQCKIFYTRKKV
jgi:hypothetical protein